MKRSAPERHAHMVDDPRRTKPLLAAIAALVRGGDAVLDIGTGTGVLAIAAAKAGARRVWAIDADAEALAAARAAAKTARVLPKIEFVEGLSFDLKLRERADLILCETVGSFAFDENILATLSDAKRRLLTSGGRIIPGRLELWGAPIGRLPKVEEPAEIARVKKGDLLAEPVRIATADFAKFIPREVRAKPQFKCAAGTVHAIAVWPRAVWGGDHVTDASPLCPPTHWKQGILPIEPRAVKDAERVGIEIVIGPHPDDPKRMTERLWRWLA